MTEIKAPVLVVGAGIMGAGIAQIAAQAGHSVLLYDMRAEAAFSAKQKLTETLHGLQQKGKLSLAAVDSTLSRIKPIANLEAAANVAWVIEAIVEKLDAKQSLFRQLESIVSETCVLASNTSSISVTALANGLHQPERVVGMHFFNPVPLMKLVEVVSGLQTSRHVAEAVFALAQSWGKTAVYARSTPGFIVNRIARPYYAETLALLQEQASTPTVLDACLRAVGFRMGPCELMDLIGHDTNFSVTRSVYEANFYDKRFVPSLVQQELVDAGLLGRKSGQGFYDYRPDAAKVSISVYEAVSFPAADSLVVLGEGKIAEYLATTLQQAGRSFERLNADWVGLQVDAAQLRLTDGRSASELGAEVAVFDLPLKMEQGMPLAYAVSIHASPAWTADAGLWLRAFGFNGLKIADAPALVVARTIAMLINEAADAVQQAVCNTGGADAAMKLGVNYPAGPFEWLAAWDTSSVVRILQALNEYYCGERYRVSPWLKQRSV